MRIHVAIGAYLGIGPQRVLEIKTHAPSLYRRYSVPKKGGGVRHIYHPAKETKTIQAAAIDLLYRDDLVHDCVKGYVRGLRSPLLKNASAHAGKLFLLRLDFCDFFPSIKPEDFKAVCGKRLMLNGTPLDKDDLDFLSDLFFVFNHRLGWFLGIGAPSSPFVSNWVMYNLDCLIWTASRDMGCVYTRYADDLCFSSNSKAQLLEVEKGVQGFLVGCSHPRLTLNSSKRRMSSKWSRRRVTGLTITPRQEVVVPRKTKRYIRSLLRKYIAGAMKPEEKRSLAGYLAFLNDCEPRYINNLVLKYGADIVREAFTMEYWKSTTGRSVS